MTNTATKGAHKLADAEGIDITALDGGVDERVNLQEVKAAIKIRDAKPAGTKPAAAAVAPEQIDGVIVYLGMGNSASTVAHGVGKVLKAHPNASLLVQCKYEIAGDNLTCVNKSVSKFIADNAKAFDSSPIALNGAVQANPERIRKGLRDAYRPQDEG